MKKIKVLMVYHCPDIMPIQAIFNAIGSLGFVELRVLGPLKGWNPYRQIWHETPLYKKYENYEIVAGRIFRCHANCANPFISGLSREIRHFQPDIIHVMNEVTSAVLFQALFLKNLFRPKAKVLFWGAENLLDKKFKRGNVLKKIIWGYNAKHADGGGYVNSEGIAQLKKMGYPTQNVMVTYWGIALEKYRKQNVDDLLVKYNLKNKIRIGYVGRISENKGLLTVLKAMRHLPNQVTFITVGNGDFLGTLRQKAKEFNLEDRFLHIPQVEDTEVARFMSLFDLFVLPSETTPMWKEQFGRVIAEAMSCALPIVGSDSGAIPEALKGSGFIFKEGDERDLANKISALINLPETEKEKQRQLSLKTAQEHYSTEEFARKMGGLYQDVLGKN